MGQAKIRKNIILNSPCLCLSGNLGRECCYNGQKWHKAPALLGLKAMPRASRTERCYMNELCSCSGGISKEHLISKSVILLLKGDGDFSISGLPWQNGGSNILSPDNLTANCLCRAHNSALSPLDTAAKNFFSTLKSYLEKQTHSVNYIASGHDIERWLLKTTKALAASGNLSQNGERLSGAFASDIGVIEMIDNPQTWPDSTGLYCVMNPGEMTANHPRFQLEPLVNPNAEISGIRLNILGLSFILVLEPMDMSKPQDLKPFMFRPSQIIVDYHSTKNVIQLSWEDGKSHTNAFTMKHLQDIN